MFSVLAEDYKPPKPEKKEKEKEYPRFPIELPELERNLPAYSSLRMHQVYFRRKWNKQVNREVFKKYRLAQHNAVKDSPEIVTNPFYVEMIKTGWSGYNAQRHVLGEYEHNEKEWRHPVWSFNRFGRTKTVLEQVVETSCIGILPIGTKVFIAGEHEDSYDFDFFIYNDVIVVKPDGTIHVLQYRTDDLPPTDGHTATLIDGGQKIALLGSVGYKGHRGPKAQVCILDLQTMKCQLVTDTTGDDPGWIGKETLAELVEDGRIQIKVHVPDSVELEEGCRPGRWIYNVKESSWTAVPPNSEDFAEAKRYEENIANGTYDPDLQQKRWQEEQEKYKRENDDDELMRRLDALIIVEANMKTMERLVKEREELKLQCKAARKQLDEDKKAYALLTGYTERRIEYNRLTRAITHYKEDQDEVTRLCEEYLRLSKETDVLLGRTRKDPVKDVVEKV